MTTPRIAVGPKPIPFALDAVRRGGCTPVAIGEPSDGLVWLAPDDVDGLKKTLEENSDIRWVQLPFAGVENFVSNSIVTEDRVWTCAKGSYAEPVSEHALLLALAGLRKLHERARAHSWGQREGLSLFDARVTILGGGGIARSLLSLLAPFRVHATVLRRHTDPVPGAERVVETSKLLDTLPGSLVVFVAMSLTPETTGIISTSALNAMDENAWLVNVARGRHVVTDDLVAALHQRAIAGAALDVTDPEPLPDGHPLWELPNCIITPHTADTPEMTAPLLANRIAANCAHFAANEPLEGLIDVASGY